MQTSANQVSQASTRWLRSHYLHTAFLIVVSLESCAEVGAMPTLVSNASGAVTTDSTSSGQLDIRNAAHEVAVGGTIQFKLLARTAQNYPNAARIVWTSRDSTIASIDSLIRVVGVAEGDTWITAADCPTPSSCSLLDSARISVVGAATLHVAPGARDLLVGDSAILSVTPVSLTEWSTDSPRIATVSNDGHVHAVGPGNAKISAVMANGRYGSSAITVRLAGGTSPGVPDTARVTPNDSNVVPIVPSAPAGSRVSLPRIFLDTLVLSARNAVTRRTIKPMSGASLQAAIDSARFGDVIELAPGVTYTGTTTLRRKQAGSGWITIRGVGNVTGAGTRIRPSINLMWPRLVAASGVQPALATESGANHYLIQGVEITAPSGSTQGYTLVAIGSGGSTQATLPSQPSQIVFDRDYIHGSPTYDFQRCLSLNGAAVAVVDSWISDCHGKGYDSQAISIYNGAGPFKIQNNYLEAAGENILVGGADASSADLLPADIDIRDNHIFKPLSWAGRWTIKNLLELKVGVRVLIEGNLLENCWTDAQGGTAIVMKSVNQDGSAYFSETRDVTVRGNIIRNVVNGVGLAGHPEAAPAIPMTHVALLGNWFDNLNGNGVVVSTENVAYLYIEGNTGFGNRAGLRFNGGPAMDSIILRSNVLATTIAGPQETISGDNVMYGATTLLTYAKSWDAALNVFIGAPRSAYPPGNFFPSDVAAVGFESSIERPIITSNSQFFGVGDNNKSPGADIGTLISMDRRLVVSP